MMPTFAGNGPPPSGATGAGAAATGEGPPSGLPALFTELVATLTSGRDASGAPDAAGGAGVSPHASNGGASLAPPAGLDSGNLLPSGPPATSPSGSLAGASDAVPSSAPATPDSPLIEALSRLFEAVEALAGSADESTARDAPIADAEAALADLNALLAEWGYAPGPVPSAPAPAVLSTSEAEATAAPPAPAPVEPLLAPAVDDLPGSGMPLDARGPVAANSDRAPGRVVRLAAHLNALASRLEAVAPELAETLRALPARFAPLRNAPAPSAAPTAAEVPAGIPNADSAAARPPSGQLLASGLSAGELPRSAAPPPTSADVNALPLHLFARATNVSGVDSGLVPGRPAPAGAPSTLAPTATALAVEIVRRFEAGLTRFQIRLDPPELGRIDVRLDIDGDRFAARLSVDRPETLDVLQRDARALERALNQAGLNGDRPSLEFTLRHNPFAGRDGTGETEPTVPVNTPPPGVPGPVTAIVGDPVHRGLVRPGGVDLYV